MSDLCTLCVLCGVTCFRLLSVSGAMDGFYWLKELRSRSCLVKILRFSLALQVLAAKHIDSGYAGLCAARMLPCSST